MESRISRKELIKTTLGVAGAASLSGCVETFKGFGKPRKGRKTVHFWHLLSGQWQAPTEEMVRRYNESQSKYEVIPLLVPDKSADSKFLLSVAGGDPPDVMLHWTQAMSTWAEGGILTPLDSLMTADEMRRFKTESYPVIAKSGWYKGRLYGITVGFDLWTLFYRVDHFKEAGIDPDPAKFPATLEGVVELGKQLDRKDKSGALTRIGFLPQTLINYVPSFGGWFYDEKQGELTINTPENLRALQFLVDQRKRIGFQEAIRFVSGLSSSAGVDMPFIGGSYSIMMEGEWRVEHLRNFAPDLEYHTVFAPPPKGGRPRASFSSTNFITIPAGAKEVDGAWDFIRWWAGLDDLKGSAEFYPPFGWMPRGEAAVHTPQYQEYLRKAPQYQTFLNLAQSSNIEITPSTTYQLFLMDRITKIDDLAVRGSLSPEQALNQLEADVQQERQRRKDLGYAE